MNWEPVQSLESRCNPLSLADTSEQAHAFALAGVFDSPVQLSVRSAVAIQPVSP